MLLYKQITSLNNQEVKKTITRLLKEDIPSKDLTTEATIESQQIGKYIFRSRQKMVFCGAPIILNAFSKEVVSKVLIKDGETISKGTEIATIRGSVQEILMKERIVLNMIQHLSGISTNTSKYIKALKNNEIKILDTRKTTPGLRLYEKYAVNKGGGSNHRLDLSSGIMVKDNHIASSNIEKIHRNLKAAGEKTPIQIEVDNINQITDQNIQVANAFLLDNMSPIEIKKCVQKINQLKQNKSIFIEVSGGINLKNIAKYNIQGVHGISIGALTHQSQSVDIGLDFD